MSIFVLGLGMISIVLEPDLDADRFQRLIGGLHSETRDVTLLFEGNVRVGDGAGAAGPEVSRAEESFQGRYSYRSDGATFLDFYEQGTRDDDRQKHQLLQSLGGISSISAVPDRGLLTARPPPERTKSTTPVRPGPLSQTGSPARILFLWFFQGLTDPRNLRYEFKGWESVGGHACIVVELDCDLGLPPESRDRFRMWIDLDRGGHPLRVDLLKKGRVFARSRDIQLTQYRDPKGVARWLPVAGIFESFVWMPRTAKELQFFTEPVLVESYHVVTGSVLLNQGLTDPDLTIGPNAGRYGEFKSFKGFQKPKRLDVRNNPKEAQKRLDDRLEEADRDAARLQASVASSNAWGSGAIFSYLMAVVGLVLLLIALAWSRSAR